MQSERTKWTDERLDDLFVLIRSMDEKLDARFDKVDARFDKVDARFETLETKVDRRFDNLTYTLIAVLIAVVTALGGIATAQTI